MRSSLVLVPAVLFLLACGGSETPAVDSAATAAAPAPAGLTEADFAGTWNGTATVVGDTAKFTFTDVCGAGTCRSVISGMPDTVTSTYVIEGDSVVGNSAPRMDPNFKTNIVERWVLRIASGTATGTSVVKPADKDSVLMTLNFTATKAAQ